MPRLHIPSRPYSPAQFRQARAAWLGFAGSLLARCFGGHTSRVRTGDLSKCDYRMSTQRIGMHFSERIRDAFRFRWIKKVS